MDHNVTTSGENLELRLSGKFTFADNKSFTNILDDISQSSYKNVVIDLASVEFIDSAALGILLLTRDKCEKSSTALLLRNPRGQVKQMFDISRFNDLFRIEYEAA
jgi:anti-anti-sigma factor